MTREQLAAVVMGRPEAWRVVIDVPVASLLRDAESHGVLPLLAETARAQPSVPKELAAALADAAAREAALDAVREFELRRVVEALAGAGVQAIIMKGADLAYRHYARPDLRPRTDSDLLVGPEARPDAAAMLRSLGYDAVAQTGGSELMYQEPFRLMRGPDVVHVVDLHWRVFNPQRYRAVLTFPEVFAASEARPALGPAARGLPVAEALLLACVHRVAHHHNHERLIWLYDIRVLAAAMQARDWERVSSLASNHGQQSACWRTLAEAERLFDVAVPAGVIDALRAGAHEGGAEAAFLDPRAPHVRRVLNDLRHVGGWRRRIALAGQHLFPPADYMRNVYAPTSRLPLWALYLRRIARGSRRWLVRS